MLRTRRLVNASALTGIAFAACIALASPASAYASSIGDEELAVRASLSGFTDGTAASVTHESLEPPAFSDGSAPGFATEATPAPASPSPSENPAEAVPQLPGLATEVGDIESPTSPTTPVASAPIAGADSTKDPIASGPGTSGEGFVELGPATVVEGPNEPIQFLDGYRPALDALSAPRGSGKASSAVTPASDESDIAIVADSGPAPIEKNDQYEKTDRTQPRPSSRIVEYPAASSKIEARTITVAELLSPLTLDTSMYAPRWYDFGFTEENCCLATS